MKPELRKQLEQSSSLPSLPSVALQILDLCQKDEIDLAQVARVVSNDPALVVKLLRTANSPLFGPRAEIVSVQQAISLLGVNAVRTLVLSFSLASAKRSVKAQGLDGYWRRSVLSAIVSRELARHLGLNEDEALICGLLQDIGILAFSSCLGAEYGRIQKASAGSHDGLTELEFKLLGADHTEAGAWLLDRWGTPKSVVLVVAASHNPESLVGKGFPGLYALAQVVAAAGSVADLWTSDGKSEPSQRGAEAFTGRVSEEIGRYWPNCGFDAQTFATRLVDVAHSVAPLFDAKLSPGERTQVLERAKEALVNVSVRTSRELALIEESVAGLEIRARLLLVESQRDPLTGVANRGCTNAYLEDSFRRAVREKSVLGVIFADIDHFKRINDTYGHLAGDAVLQSVAGRIAASVRGVDFTGRFGGEEFLVIVQCDDPRTVLAVAERIRHAVGETRHSLGNSQTAVVTLSLGCAVLNPARHKSCWDMVEDADRSLYVAKDSGRNRVHRAAA